LEVLILDDASQQIRVKDVIAQSDIKLSISCVRSETCLGVAGGRNYLMTNARGEIIVVLDDDSVLASAADISNVAAAFAQSPQVGVVAFKIINHVAGKTNLLVPFSRRSLKKRPRLSDEPRLVSYFLGGGHALRKAMLQTTGLYEGRLMYYGEELDLAYRVINSGMTIYYCPSIVVNHYASGESPKGEVERYYYSLRNSIWIGYRYLRTLNAISYLLAKIGYFALIGLRHRRIGAFLRAIRDGFGGVKTMQRVSLTDSAITYLRQNYGRLWY
jgi:GT2 family glycosyltransferase